MRHRSKRIAAGIGFAVMLAAAPGAARAADESLAYAGLVGAGAALRTLVYAPLKIAYAAGGLVISGLAWAWTAGDTYVSGPIYTASVGGDYVITLGHLEGRRSVMFLGGAGS